MTVDGTGAIDATAGHSEHFLRDRVLVTGSNLQGASGALRTKDSAEWQALTAVDGGSTTAIAFYLPTATTPGEYVLRVANAGGEDEAAVWLLQGEPGLVGNVSVISTIGDRATAGNQRSIAIDDLRTESEYLTASEQSAAGVYVVLFDLESHTVMLDPPPQVYGSSQFSDLAALLAGLPENVIAIMASGGDVSSISTNAELVDALQNLGAGHEIEDLAPDTAITAILRRGTVLGAGLRFVSSEEEGLAHLATLVIEQTLLGWPSTAVPLLAGTLEEGQWCKAADGKIECTETPPIPEESDPTVNSLGKATLSCQDSEIPKRSSGGWVCSADGTVAETQVDDWVANNNYLVQPDALACDDGWLIGWDDAQEAWTCVAPEITSERIADATLEFADMSDNGCVEGDVIKFDGNGWSCGEDIDTTYQAGTGISLSGNSFVAALGTSISSAEIEDGSIAVADIGIGAVDSGSIFNGTIATVDIADGAITSVKIADATISSDDILNGTIATADLADSAVTAAKIFDGTIATADLADGAITSPKIFDGSIATADINDSTISSAKIIDGTIATTDIADSTITSAKIGDGTIAAADINDSAVTSAKIADGTIVSADISDGIITAADLATGAISSDKIYDGTIATADLADDAITSAKIFDGAIAATDLADGAITSAKIFDGAIAAADINDSAITSAKIFDGTVASADISDGTITTADIASSAITSDRIADSTIASIDILDSAIQTADINDSAITSAKIVDATLALADLGANGCAAGHVIQRNSAGTAWECAPNVSGVATSPTAGTTDSLVWDSNDVGRYSAITIGTDGFPIIAFYDASNGNLGVAKCGDAACSTRGVFSVDYANDVGKYPSIAIGTDGFPVISYYYVTDGDLRVVKCGNAACTSENNIVAVDTTNNSGTDTSITIGTDGFPVVSYIRPTTGSLMVAKCNNASCSSSTISEVRGPWATVESSGTAITVGSDGLPVFSYYYSGAPRLAVIKCGNASCTVSQTNDVDTAGAAMYSSIAIASSGYPIISYNLGSSLKVAHCGGHACTSGNTLTLIEGVAVETTSIVVGTDGLPVVSYYDASNFDLRLARCGNAMCSANNSTFAVASTNTVGNYNSITVGTDGSPVISYYDATNGDLRVAKCTNPYCLSYWRRR